jgi:uncharacterized protein YdaU (DUF1376 family)
MNKPPAFQFYVNDWLSSKTVALMTPAQEGAYIRLLAYAWSADDCGLNDDDQELSVLSRLGEGWFNGGSTAIRKCFIQRDGRLYNERLLEERKKKDEWIIKSQEGGVRSGEARKNKDLRVMKGGSTTLPTVVEPKSNSSISISNNSTSPIGDVCSEASSEPPPANDPVVMTFDCTGNVKSWDLHKSKRDEYAESYPGLDIDAQLRIARQWIRDNPEKRKTARGMAAFLGRWMAREVDKAHGAV